MTAHRNRHRFDHDAAFHYWTTLPPAKRSFANVGRKFSVSNTTIRNVAKRDNWEQRLGELERQAARIAEKRVVKALAERKADTIAVADRLRDVVLTAPAEEIDLTAAIRSIPRYVHFEQIFEGEATSRVELAEVQPAFDAFHRAALELARIARPADQAATDRVLARLDEELAALAALAAQTTAGGVAA